MGKWHVLTAHIMFCQQISIQLVAQPTMFSPPLVDISCRPKVQWFGFSFQDFPGGHCRTCSWSCCHTAAVGANGTFSAWLLM